MGAEFLRNSRKTNVKNIDRGRARLATPTLFTQTPEDQPRCAVAKMSPDSSLKCGDAVIVEQKNGGLVAMRGQSVVAKFSNPPSDIVSAIKKGVGVAKGKIRKINPISKTVDIAIC